MDHVPPDQTNPPVTDQPSENNIKIIKFAPKRPAPVSGRKTPPVDLKVKLDNYRAIFNASPKGSDVEKTALGKLVELSMQMPEDDKDKHEYVQIALDFYDGDEAVTDALYQNLTALAEKIPDKEDQLKAYRVLMRHKRSDEKAKERIGGKMLEILESV